jgi:hypothetical protein
MSFAESGGVITQTGTDTDLTGLVGVAGVTNTTSNGKAIYQIANKQLVIDGTLTMDPEIEEMFFTGYGNVITLEVNNGTFNIGQEINVGAVANRFSGGTAIRFDRASDSTFAEASSDVYVDTGGTLNWYGGSIISARQLANYGTLNTYSDSCQWITFSALSQFRIRSSNTSIDGLVTSNGFLVAAIFIPTLFSGWKPFGASKVLSLSFATPADTWVPVSSFDDRGVNGQSLTFTNDKWGRLINPFSGTSVDIRGNADDSANNKGLWEIRQELTINTKDSSGNSLNGIKAHIADTNNGSRLSSNQIGSNPSYTADRTYTDTSSSGSVSWDTDGGILVGVIWRDTGGLRDDDNIYDYRCISGDDTDDFVANLASYEYNPNTQNLVLKGGADGQVVVDAFMLPDVALAVA